MSKNKIIDKIIGLLGELKEGDEKPFTATLKYDMISVRATIDRKKQRISIRSNPTSTSIVDRKGTTIKGLAECMLQAVDLMNNPQK